MYGKKEMIVEGAAWVALFWLFKAFVATITCVYFGITISCPIVYLWNSIFQCFNADILREFFCSVFTMHSCDATPEILAVNYLRIGLLETPVVIAFYLLYLTSEKNGCNKDEV